MKFNGFSLSAEPFIHDAFCECGDRLRQVSNGWLSAALYCTKCENVYMIKKVKLPKKKVTKEFLKQCREETKPNKQ